MRFAAWKSGFLGFLISAAITSAVCLSFYLSADLASSRSPDIKFRTELADQLRFHAYSVGTMFVGILAFYWMLAALYGRGNIASFKWANYPLITAFGIAILLLSNDFFFWIETYCDQWPQSHTGFSVLRITECPSSGIALSGMATLAFLLTIHSLLFRITASRQEEKSSL